MKNFILFFNQKEGTSPLVRMLDKLNNVSVVHQVDNQGWEPFDYHRCGHISFKDLKRCFSMLFDNKTIDMNVLNSIYTKTASAPLEKIGAGTSIGFKMRLNYLHKKLSYFRSMPRIRARLQNYWNAYLRNRYKHMLFRIFKKNSVIVFVAIRQDILRWSLSKYHGDGTGKNGHLQFRLANSKIDRESIPSIQVECDRLEAVIKRCYKLIEDKRSLIRELQQRNVEVYPIFYEAFNQDKRAFLQDMLAKLDVSANTSEIDMCIEKGTRLKKVHSDDISSFV